MIDIREQILSRLPEVCTTITGIVAVARNRLDVNSLYRPAIVTLDAAEELFLAQPNSSARFGQVQMMELAPEVRLLLRADDGGEAGTITSLFRGRIITAVLGDATLRTLVGASGTLRYGGCSVPEPNPETKEPRLDLTFNFIYPLRLADLT